MATADPRSHVLSATTYSKSVLRVYPETLRRDRPFVHYFSSYEIITVAFNRGKYYAEDLRNVTENVVAHVMRLFLLHAAGVGTENARVVEPGRADDDFVRRVEELVEVECDEVALDKAS